MYIHIAQTVYIKVWLLSGRLLLPASGFTPGVGATSSTRDPLERDMDAADDGRRRSQDEMEGQAKIFRAPAAGGNAAAGNPGNTDSHSGAGVGAAGVGAGATIYTEVGDAPDDPLSDAVVMAGLYSEL